MGSIGVFLLTKIKNRSGETDFSRENYEKDFCTTCVFHKDYITTKMCSKFVMFFKKL